MKIIISLLFTAVCLIGCATIEEGEVDYVRTIANKATDAKTLAKCSPGLYPVSEYAKAGFTRDCYETLYRKYTKVPEVRVGDTVSVHLMQAFNGYAHEWRSPSEFFGRRGANAEIVVIANVCEQGVPGCSLRYGPESDKSGRVIFYSNGVKAKQYLNFSYLPVYGPIKYQGGPLILQISILELDNPSEQQKNLLSTLAEAGKKAYPPASEALSVLDKVGSSLMAGNSDDIIFRYTMSLVPSSTELNYQSPIIAEGNYAFIRKNTWAGALEEQILGKLKFDNLSGRLVEECIVDDHKLKVKVDENGREDVIDYSPCTVELNSGLGYKDYRKNTYLTFQIKSGFAEATLDNIQSFSTLLSEINVESDVGALQAIEATHKLKEEINRNKQQNILFKEIEGIKKLLANIDEDTYDLYDNKIYKLSQEYDAQITKYTSLTCSSNPKKGCELLMTPDQLLKVQLKLRALLQDINPTASIGTEIPSGYSKLGSNINVEFVEGFQLYYNNFIFQRYLADLESIQAIINNITLAKLEGKDVDSSQALLKGEVTQFLNRLSKGLALKSVLSCAVINEKCYRYLNDSQVTEITSIFNQMAKADGMPSTAELDKTAKSAAENIAITNSLNSLQ